MCENVRAQVVAHLIRIPLRRVQQPLHAIRRLLSGSFGELPAILALDRAHQPPQVGHGPPTRFCPHKAQRQDVFHLLQGIGPTP
jgi:hypothetical protein